MYASSEKLQSEPRPPTAWHQASEMSWRGDSANTVWKHLAKQLSLLISLAVPPAFTLSIDELITKAASEPYPVRFEPIAVLVVHAETNKLAHPYMKGPMDTNFVKNGATVTDKRQKLNYTDFWHVSRLARPRQLLDSLCVTGKDKSVVKSHNSYSAPGDSFCMD